MPGPGLGLGGTGMARAYLTSDVASGVPDIRSSLPLRAHEVLVEGHEIQGEGCTPQNLQSLVRAFMQVQHFPSVVDYLIITSVTLADPIPHRPKMRHV